MRDWAAENARLRLDRDAMDEAKRREAEAGSAIAAASGNCRCTEGTVCRHNAACPRGLAQHRAAR